MKRWWVAASVFLIGLFLVDYFFDVNVPRLARGFADMLVEMFTATRP